MSVTTDTSSTEIQEKVDLFFALNIKLEKHAKRYFLDDFDVSLSFFNYQKLVQDFTKINKIKLKYDYADILSLSSILLLETDVKTDLMVRSFNINSLNKIVQYIKEKDMKTTNYSFSMKSMWPLLHTVHEVTSRRVNREEGSLSMMNAIIK